MRIGCSPLSKISKIMHDDNDRSLVTTDLDCILANRKVLNKVANNTIDSPFDDHHINTCCAFISTTIDQRGLPYISLVLAGEVDTIMDIGCVNNTINSDHLLSLPRVFLHKPLYLWRLLDSLNPLDVTRW